LIERPSARRVIALFARIVLVGGLALPGMASAFERDVHFGLTKWLALKAGFTAQQADALATGDQRVDSGDMQFIELVTAYACLAANAESAALAERHHYPSASPVPAPAEQRSVSANSESAQKFALDTTKVSPSQAGFLLFKFAEALHAVQDSWSHQGVPDLPRPLDGAIACDSKLAWAHPASRGGWNSHKADLTRDWPGDTIAMAKASYDLLLRYPDIGDVKRAPRDWAEIRPLLDDFVRASTKTDKKRWFIAQGIADVSFLEGISLADGAEAFTLQWGAHRLPRLPTAQSSQHHIDAGLLDFYSRFFIQWMSNDDFDALAAEFGAPAPVRGKTGAASPPAMLKPELASRLRAWRVRDHGRVAELAHATRPLTPVQRSTLASLTRDGKALAHYASPAEAFFPLEVKGAEPSPLLGFLISPTAPSPGGNERAAAMTKLRHAPYDVVVVLAERMEGQWRIVSVGATVDH